MTQGIIVILVAVVLGLALSSTVGTFAAQAAGNATGSAATIYNLVPVFWAIFILVIAAAGIYLVMQ